jgi:hypothetical protein
MSRQAEMVHQLYASLDELLALETLSELEGRRIGEIRRLDFHSVDSLSGSRFLRIETVGADDGQVRRFVIKRLSREWDWIMRATGDHGRAALAWQSGLLDEVPAIIDHGVVACAIDGDGHALLMRDLSQTLIPPGDDPISVDENARFLEAMAAMHAHFWGKADLASPARGFCGLVQHYHMLAPETGHREANGPDPIPKMLLKGWALLPELVERDVHDVIARLLEDPQPLCEALGPYTQTVVQGDWKLGNLGLHQTDDRRVVLLDWDRVSAGPALFDLVWYLAVNSARLPLAKEATIEMYRGQLEAGLGAAFEDEDWQRQLDLTLLGGFLQLGWPKLLGAASDDEGVCAREQQELRWWSEKVRAGALVLGRF